MRYNPVLTIGAIVMVFYATISIADANDDFKKCIGCHGYHGEKVAMGKSKILADMNSSEIEDAINGYKDNSYGGPLKMLMKAQVKDLNKTQVKELSDFIGK